MHWLTNCDWARVFWRQDWREMRIRQGHYKSLSPVLNEAVLKAWSGSASWHDRLEGLCLARRTYYVGSSAAEWLRIRYKRHGA